MNESGKVTNNTQNGGPGSLGAIAAGGLFLDVAAGAVILILPRAFDPLKTLFGDFFWNLPVLAMPVVVIISVFCIILGLASGLITAIKKRRRFWRKAAVFATMAGLFGLTFSGVGAIVMSETPFKKITVKSIQNESGNDREQEAERKRKRDFTVLRKNMPGIWLRIDGNPLNNAPGSLSFELRRYARNTNDPEPLSISGLKRDPGVNQGIFYFPKQGNFIVRGSFMAGDRLVFLTTNESGFFEEGKIFFAFWESFRVFEEENSPGFEGTIVFEPKEGAAPGNISYFEGKIKFEPDEIPAKGEDK